jgi:hypothetical protein
MVEINIYKSITVSLSYMCVCEVYGSLFLGTALAPIFKIRLFREIRQMKLAALNIMHRGDS